MYPIPTQAVVRTVYRIAQEQGAANFCEVLEAAVARIEESGYDNWNGGTTYYTLFLDIPISLFARLESDREEIERGIQKKVDAAIRQPDNDRLSSVSIAPILETDKPDGPRPVAGVDPAHLWESGFLRLFLSHISSHKQQVSGLRAELKVFCVDGFVAHEDIEPTEEWQAEIERALASMHALAALLTTDYPSSKWTDQEVGVALGRGVLVVPVGFDLDPYGFIGKNQELSGSLDKPRELASEMVAVLGRNERTSIVMREALVMAIERAQNFECSKRIAFPPDRICWLHSKSAFEA